ncbi:MAG: hypothetical protein EOR72_32585 [Mesorhizobium sp.]|nr:MAG: hypothetical protein EOR72_32585 [Mesorhizobium sp.]
MRFSGRNLTDDDIATLRHLTKAEGIALFSVLSTRCPPDGSGFGTRHRGPQWKAQIAETAQALGRAIVDALIEAFDSLAGDE